MAAWQTNKNGFSLIELIMVLLIVSVVTIYISTRFSPGDSSVHSEAARVASDLRHTQSLAMHRGESLILDLLSASSYQITDTSGSVITDPASGENYSYTINSSVSRSGSCGDVRFDSMGRPALVGSGLISAPCTYILSGTTQSSTITLTPVTGFLVVNP